MYLIKCYLKIGLVLVSCPHWYNLTYKKDKIILTLKEIIVGGLLKKHCTYKMIKVTR